MCVPPSWNSADGATAHKFNAPTIGNTIDDQMGNDQSQFYCVRAQLNVYVYIKIIYTYIDH